MRDDPAVIDLVERARRKDKSAWNEIVRRYSPLVWSVCVRHRLAEADGADVVASVWLRLIERLDTIKEPAALPGWLATTTRHECLQLIRAKGRQVPVDGEMMADEATPAADEWLLVQERRIALRAAFDALSQRCRELLSMLFADPPVPYAEVSQRLEIKIGGIGPTRMRCLDELRRHCALSGYQDTDDEQGG